MQSIQVTHIYEHYDDRNGCISMEIAYNFLSKLISNHSTHAQISLE